MVLVDTSVWVDHLRRDDSILRGLLRAGQVATHPLVIGELACGNLKNRIRILELLRALPAAKVATQAEVLRLIEDRSLHGKGLGIVDVHLLASALLSRIPLWTKDERLARIAGVIEITVKL